MKVSTLCFCRAFIWEFDFSDWATKWHSNFENVNGISQPHMVGKYTVSHLKNTMPHCSSLMAGNDTNLSSMIEPSIKLHVTMTNYVGKSLVHLHWADKELGALIRNFVLVTVAPKRYIVLPQCASIYRGKLHEYIEVLKYFHHSWFSWIYITAPWYIKHAPRLLFAKTFVCVYFTVYN